MKNYSNEVAAPSDVAEKETTARNRFYVLTAIGILNALMLACLIFRV